MATDSSAWPCWWGTAVDVARHAAGAPMLHVGGAEADAGDGLGLPEALHGRLQDLPASGGRVADAGLGGVGPHRLELHLRVAGDDGLDLGHQLGVRRAHGRRMSTSSRQWPAAC